MADERISALPDGSPALTTDLLGVTRTVNVATRRVTAASIAQLLNTIGRPITTITLAYLVAAGDHTILANPAGPITVTLPLASTVAGMIVNIKNLSVSTVTIAASGADTIDGAASKTLPVQYGSYTLHSNGTNWYIL